MREIEVTPFYRGGLFFRVSESVAQAVPYKFVEGEVFGQDKFPIPKSVTSVCVRVPLDFHGGTIFGVEDFDEQASFAGSRRVVGDRDAQDAVDVFGADRTSFR